MSSSLYNRDVNSRCRSQQCQRLKPESKVSNYKTRLKYYAVRSHVPLTLSLKQHRRNGDEDEDEDVRCRAGRGFWTLILQG